MEAAAPSSWMKLTKVGYFAAILMALGNGCAGSRISGEKMEPSKHAMDNG
jgi:hypothetical protein